MKTRRKATKSKWWRERSDKEAMDGEVNLVGFREKERQRRDEGEDENLEGKSKGELGNGSLLEVRFS